MLNYIQNRRTRQGKMDVMPRHTGGFKDADLVRDEVVDLLEVHNPTVVVILSWEKGASKVRGVAVS